MTIASTGSGYIPVNFQSPHVGGFDFELINLGFARAANAVDCIVPCSFCFQYDWIDNLALEVVN